MTTPIFTAAQTGLRVIVIEDESKVRLSAKGMAAEVITISDYADGTGFAINEAGIPLELSADDNTGFLQGPGKYLVNKATGTADVYAIGALGSSFDVTVG
jgi:hypothetical protein